MSDNLKNAGGQDRRRINVHQAHELHDWSAKFRVSEEALKNAVQQVGDQASAVEQYLQGQGREKPSQAPS